MGVLPERGMCSDYHRGSTTWERVVLVVVERHAPLLRAAPSRGEAMSATADSGRDNINAIAMRGGTTIRAPSPPVDGSTAVATNNQQQHHVSSLPNPQQPPLPPSLALIRPCAIPSALLRP